MRNLIIKAIPIFCLSLFPSMALGNQAVGQLTNVSGQVLIERNGNSYTASEDSYLFQGDRIISQTGSSSVLEFNEGCDQVLEAEHAIEIGVKDNCVNVPVKIASSVDNVQVLDQSNISTPSTPSTPSTSNSAIALSNSAIALSATAAAAIGIVIASDSGANEVPAASP